MKRRMCRIVGIGGGTGLPALLAGLNEAIAELDKVSRPELEITAVVSVADDGGSTGELRRTLGIPAVGDMRRCIVALANGGRLWNDLFEHRFRGGDGLDGHTVGNLIMAALIQQSGSLEEAVDLLYRPLGVRGRVLPATDQPITLCAELDGRRIVSGESHISLAGGAIRRVWLHPEAPPPGAGVVDALSRADAIVIGPGSLYTSLIPNLLVPRVAAAVRESSALRIFACNLMTEPGETDGLDATDHLEALERYLGEGTIDVCLAQAPELPTAMIARYADRGATPVHCDRKRIAATGAVPVFADLLDRGPELGRHDPLRLGRLVIQLARGLRRRRSSLAPAVAGAVSPPPQRHTDESTSDFCA